MTAFCQKLPSSVAGELLQLVARALCERPGDTAAQRDSRTRQMVLTSLGFAPRDGLEFMLATLAFGHFQLLLDAMHDVIMCQNEVVKARTRTAVVALNRTMLGLLRELRQAGSRPEARDANAETHPVHAMPCEASMADPAEDGAAMPADDAAASEQAAVAATVGMAVNAEDAILTRSEQAIAPATQPTRTFDPRPFDSVVAIHLAASGIEWQTDAPDEDEAVDDATLLRRYAENEELLAVSRALCTEATIKTEEAAGDGGMNGARAHITI